MYMDHVVIWAESAKRSLDFYVNVLGLTAVRAEAFTAGAVPFPSVRINEHSLIDIMERKNLASTQEFTGSSKDAGGQPVNHVCLSMNQAEYEALIERLNGHGITLTSAGENVFGAQGDAVRSTYFNDPDGNVLEIRFYQ